MNLRKIKALLVERGITQRSIARKLGVSFVTVSVVINGYGTSKRIKKAIARALGMRVEELWGDRKVA